MAKRKSSRFHDNKVVKWAKWGNWCGPGWTAGQALDADDMTEQDKRVPAVNELDPICKKHDIDIHDATTDEDIEEANKLFVRNAKQQGITGKLMGSLVEHFGPRQVRKRKKNEEVIIDFDGKSVYQKKKMPRLRNTPIHDVDMEDVDNFEHGGVTADDTMGNEPVVTTLRKSDGVVPRAM